MAIFEKYVNRTDFTSYEDFKENFRICVPEKFNFAYDVLDQLAKDKPEEQALVWCNEENDEKIFRQGGEFIKEYGHQKRRFRHARSQKTLPVLVCHHGAP